MHGSSSLCLIPQKPVCANYPKLMWGAIFLSRWNTNKINALSCSTENIPKMGVYEEACTCTQHVDAPN